jgi:hypothetical protein
MTEEKKKNTSVWMTALKEFNSGKQWSVPKKDTPEYLEVLKIASKLKETMPPKEVKPKPTRKAVASAVKQKPKVLKVKEVNDDGSIDDIEETPPPIIVETPLVVKVKKPRQPRKPKEPKV